MLVPPLVQRVVGITHGLRLAAADHHLKIDWLEAGIFIAVNNAGGRGNTLPWSEPRRDALAALVLHKHVEETLQHEEYFFDLMGMRGIALSGLDVHDGQSEVSGGNDARIAVLSRPASANEAMLRTFVTFDLGVFERGPVRLPVAKPCDILVEDGFQ